MKFSYRWLKEYVEIDLPPEELARTLTMAGFPVEASQTVGNDIRFDIDITSNRADALSMTGMAREIALLTGATFKLPPVELPGRAAKGEKALSVKVQDKRLCPRYIGRLIEGVRIAPSPAWLAERLESVGIRPVNNVVDITNFVMRECGQPLHAFDRRLLSEGRIVVRRAAEGEQIVAIDGKMYRLTPDMLVIADAARPVAVAGIMGGKESEIDERTTTVVLESASFDPGNIRSTSRTLRLASDSSYLFERGVSWEGVAWASARAAQLMREVAGGTPAASSAEDGGAPPKAVKTFVRISRASAVLGTDLNGREVVGALGKAGFCPNGRGDRRTLTVPDGRRDIRREIDVIEEIARWRGYDAIPADGNIPVLPAMLDRAERVERMIKGAMIALGYNEVMTSAFAEEAEVKNASLWSSEPVLELKSPDGKIDSRLRGSLIPCLCHIVRINEGYKEEIGDIFEIASVYYRRDGAPAEKRCLGVVSRDGFTGAKGAVEELFDALGRAGSPTFVPEKINGFRDGEACRLTVDGTTVGFLGEVSDDLKVFYDIRGAIAAAEIDMEILDSLAKIERKFEMFSRFPPARRDVALVVDEGVAWAEIRKCVTDVAPDFLKEVAFFDLYRGDKIPAGKKSVAFALTFRSWERTLAKVEVDEAMKVIVTALKTRFGGELRE